jgi:CheY-like chemotaxis protein
MGRKILLADDSITIQKVVNLTFSDEGIDVVSVGNGELAVRKLADAKPDLVLVDIFMPGRSGYEVCEYIKNNPQFSHIPVLLLVGAFEPFDQSEASRVKADGHLTKPFESRVLVATVNKLLAQAPPAPVIPTPVPTVAPPPSAPSLSPPPLPTAQPVVEEQYLTPAAQQTPATQQPFAALPTARPVAQPAAPPSDWAFSTPTIPLGSTAISIPDTPSVENSAAISFLPPGAPPSPLPPPINPLNTPETETVNTSSEPPQFDLGFDFTKPTSPPVTPMFDPQPFVSAPVDFTIPAVETASQPATPSFSLDQFEDVTHTQLMGSPVIPSAPTNLANDVWVLDTDTANNQEASPVTTASTSVPDSVDAPIENFAAQFPEDLRDTSTYASPVDVGGHLSGGLPTQDNVATNLDAEESLSVDNVDNYEEMPLDLEPLEEYITGSQEALLEISDPLSLEEIPTIGSGELSTGGLAGGEAMPVAKEAAETPSSNTPVIAMAAKDAADYEFDPRSNGKRDTGEIEMNRQTMDMLEAMPDTSLEEAIAAESVANKSAAPLIAEDQLAPEAATALASTGATSDTSIAGLPVATTPTDISDASFAVTSEKSFLPETTAEIEIVSAQDIPVGQVRSVSGPLELDLGEPLPPIVNAPLVEAVDPVDPLVAQPATTLALEAEPDLLATQQVEVMRPNIPASAPNLSLENMIANAAVNEVVEPPAAPPVVAKQVENSVPTVIVSALTPAEIDAAQANKLAEVGQSAIAAPIDEGTKKTLEITAMPLIPVTPSAVAPSAPMPSGELEITALDSEIANEVASAAEVTSANEVTSAVSNVAVNSNVSTVAITSIEQIPQELVDEIVRRTIAQMSDAVVREIAWEIVPELAELMIKKRITQIGK